MYVFNVEWFVFVLFLGFLFRFSGNNKTSKNKRRAKLNKLKNPTRRRMYPRPAHVWLFWWFVVCDGSRA
jgi:uncharacterized membrane protein (DUF106 family)